MFLTRVIRLTLASVVAVGLLRAAPVSRPNVVLLLADDLGAHDLGVTGSRFHETPHLDRLAREGVRFTQAYSAGTVCSPSRAALMTGKSPARLKITDWIPGERHPEAKLVPPADWAQQLPLSEVTLAERARSNGLATLHIGKWHLGGEGFGPLEQGFDGNLGGDHRGQPPSNFSPFGLPKLKDGPAGEYLTDREGAEAAAYIASHRSVPFFLQVAFHGVHTPLQARPELVEKYRRKAVTVGGGQTNATYAAMLESLDTAVGRILQALEDAGVAGNTVVLFTSDNGGLVLGKTPPTSNTPLRSGKGSPHEGGLRVPLIVRWPGVTQAGATSAEPVITMDVAATVAAAVSGSRETSLVDGLDLSPVLRNPAASLGRDALCWHYPHYHAGGATPFAAIRAGDWKLIQYYEEGRHELFDLAQDPGEAHDLSASQPDRVMDLARRLFDWQGKVGAQWPMGNAAFVPRPQAVQADGSILLHSRSAVVHGTTLRFEPMPFKNTLGWWGRLEDWASWSFTVDRAGDYEIELTQGCGRGHGGSSVDLVVDDRTIPFTVEETGHFQNFVVRRPGRVTLASGAHTFVVKPRTKPGGAVMDLRQIRLVPAIGEASSSETARAVLAARRVVVLGDSITYGGEWVEFAEAWIRTRFPGSPVEFLNLGLPSETVSGLSEDGHAGGSFPRPDLHERLARVLEKTKPDLILACYGMNDGIYFPLAEERFAKFRDGMRRLHETAAHAGIRVIHLTPPVFDSLPLAGRTLPEGLKAYPQPYEGYDGVLHAYSEWLVQQKSIGWDVVDVHAPMRGFIEETRRNQPAFTLAGDGIHANTQGHWLIARELLRAMGAPAAVAEAAQPGPVFSAAPRGAEILGRVQKRQRVQKDAWLTFTGHRRPGMSSGRPLDAAEAEAATIRAQMKP